MKQRTITKITMSVLLLAGSTSLQAQQRVSDGTTSAAINSNAIMELQSSNKGLLLSRVALTATNQAGPLSAHVAGMTVYNTATAGSGTTAVTPGFYYNDGTKWVRLADAQALTALQNTAWIQDGNNNGALKTIGTNDNFDLPFETNGTEKMRLTTAGNLGIGNNVPGHPLTFSNSQGRKISLYTTFENDHQYYGFSIGNAKFINQIDQLGSVFQWKAATSATASNDLMTLTGTGRLGINTTTPATRLDINNGTTNGAIKIVDGTQGAGRVLTSDANGLGTWQEAAATIYRATLGAGVDIPASTGGNWLYTGTSITLPPGKWLVNVTMILSKGTAPVPVANEAWWVRSTFSDSPTSGISADIVGSSNLISGLLPPAAPYALLTGAVTINNTSSANKTYYYTAGSVINSSNITGTLKTVGGSWAENYITYQRVN
ncbi:hypothetical protein D3C71_412210 [compost metagenome]